ncbi:MAG: hypothetical protein NDJ18_02765 [candidate division Zixibacteria bacterium]|nr:hypothetical protein [candidate division Zixibacteria bacterium]
MSTAEAQYNAFVGIQNLDLPTQKPTAWVQAGYMEWRIEGSTSSARFLYIEWKDAPDATPYILPLVDQYYVAPPAEGTVNHYELVREAAANGWAFYYNSALTVRPYAPGWQASDGSWATWETEILKRETDMPGTVNNPCEFTSCGYKLAGSGFTGAAFNSNDVIGCSGIAGNPKQWDCSYSPGGNTWYVWDVSPLVP